MPGPVPVGDSQIPSITEAGLQGDALVRNTGRERIPHFAAVPDEAAVAFACDRDAVRDLPLPGLGRDHLPTEQGMGVLDGQGLDAMLDPQVGQGRGNAGSGEGGGPEQGDQQGIKLSHSVKDYGSNNQSYAFLHTIPEK